MVLEVQNKSIDTWEQVAQEISSLKQSITTEQEIVDGIKQNCNLAVEWTNDNLTKLQGMVKESLSTTEESLLPNTDEVSSGVSAIEYPELTNKKLMEFDAGLSAIQSPGFSEFRISSKIDQKKLSAEQLKNLAAFDKVQASLYIMLCNANKRDLPAEFLMRTSVVMTKDLFDHMGDGKSGSGFDLSKITEGADNLASNKTIGAGVGELKKGADGLVKSFTESGAADMLGTAQAWLSMVNDLPDVTSKWNNFLGWIADGDLTGVDLSKSTMPAIYTVYQSCKSGYPSTEKTQGLNVAGDDADWISKNSGKMLSTNAMVLGNLNDHTEELIKSIINPKNQESLNKFVSQSEGIIDTMIETASSMGLSSDVFESMMSSWGKRFEKFAFIGRMLGVDMSPLISTLNAKLSPKQEQQLTAFLKNYQPSTAEGPHPWEEYISDDPESKKQAVILTINIGDITKGLLVMTPAASVVRQFVGDDETKKAIYFDKDETGSLTLLKDWSKVSNDDKKALVDGHIGNADVVKNLLKDVTGVEGEAMTVVGRAATGYMKGPRGKIFYDNYHKEHTNGKKKVEKTTTSKTEGAINSSQGTEVASGGFAEKLGTRYVAQNLSVGLLTKNFADLTSGEVAQVMHEFFDQGKYASQVDEVLDYVKQNPVAGLIEMFIGLAEHKDGYDNPTQVNNDPNLRSEQKNYGAFQISTKGDPIKLARDHFTNGMKKMSITGVVDPDSRLGQLIGHLGGHIDSKGSLGDLLSLQSGDPQEKFHRIIKDKIQIGGDGFKTDVHVYKMLHSKVGDMFQLPQTA